MEQTRGAWRWNDGLCFRSTLDDIAKQWESFVERDGYKRGDFVMGVLSWIILGLISGFIASKIVNKRGEGFIRDVLLGIVGAVVGGAIFQALGHQGVSGVNLGSIVIAVLGAIIVLVIYHAVVARA
jgi:uncharacterized membrane protein YeaQ/YmgE (transglycosylase-associated protein family)